ncbi:cytochrome P450 [Pyrenochaeta sp. DS3sAY3a]|nr:cytochrome P450 [Pyrenochaeta sp. DS3sAY3a]
MTLLAVWLAVGRLLAWLFGVASFALFLQLMFNFFRHRGVKGPLIARFSNLWRFYHAYQGNIHHLYIDLHRQYGNIVRIGPNCISLAGIEAKSTIYGISGPKFSKICFHTDSSRCSNFYAPFQPTIAGGTYQNLFDTTDEAFHAAIKRPVSRAYAMSTLLEYEPFVDATTQELLSQIGGRYASMRTGEAVVCDLDKWLQYYAFDVIGEITFSKSLGFLKGGQNVDDTISSLSPPMVVPAASQMPAIDRWFLKPLQRWSARRSTSAVVSFTMERMKERSKKAETRPADRRDMLSRFIHSKETNPAVIDDLRVLSYATSKVNAGADTTAITLRTTFYYLLKNLESMRALEREILEAEQCGALSAPCVSWAEAQKLPYLDAVVKEALRIHPPVGMMLERVVPEGGITIYGHYFRGGTLLGISPWVIGRDKSIYGEDADQWRPERWLECEPAQRNKMVGSSLTFGGGARTCIGKNISMLELYKVIPAMIRRFEWSLAEPADEWKTVNAFSVVQKGLRVHVRERYSSSG